MHDWSLISIQIDWIQSSLIVHLKDSQSQNVMLIAEKFKTFNISKKNEWGESISINQIINLSILDNGNSFLKVEIQSGDVFEIEAEKITFP
ncbi:hypothetical protein [Acinetobacter sp. NIPH 2699]|uniref:hypothetical protein n=1 Tax=Acinetobacter sp. NIPH 2699 TaxID=2923433 RepID=UPI001F4B9CBB|nr:hypothetical protein [Acinetobacter sp. NIPH 2699]MCH7335316.1 hypothetical protein [Acinetobacter sp. NIPH 2699]